MNRERGRSVKADASILAIVAGIWPLATLAQDAVVTDAIIAPSGLSITYLEMISDTAGPSGLTYRFRFLAPAIAGGIQNEDALFADMQWLCDSYALPRLSVLGPQPSQIVISLSDHEVPFGESAPDAVQFFEAFAPRPEACEWEMF